MTVCDFQETLKAELLEVFKDIRSRGPDGSIRNITGYCQSLPVEDADDETSSCFPYFIVRVSDGVDDDQYSIRGTVHAMILLGIYDDSRDNQGYKTILNMIQRFRERFEKNPLVGNMYRIQPKITWTLQDEDTYPYFFGGIQAKWDIMQFRKEDAYS